MNISPISSCCCLYRGTSFQCPRADDYIRRTPYLSPPSAVRFHQSPQQSSWIRPYCPCSLVFWWKNLESANKERTSISVPPSLCCWDAEGKRHQRETTKHHLRSLVLLEQQGGVPDHDTNEWRYETRQEANNQGVYWKSSGGVPIAWVLFVLSTVLSLHNEPCHTCIKTSTARKNGVKCSSKRRKRGLFRLNFV